MEGLFQKITDRKSMKFFISSGKYDIWEMHSKSEKNLQFTGLPPPPFHLPRPRRVQARSQLEFARGAQPIYIIHIYTHTYIHMYMHI